MTQGFFERFLEKRYVGHAKRERGRFRTFLLTALKRFMMNAWEKQRAVKRGGDRVFISREAQESEDRLWAEWSGEPTPDRVFEKRWAMAVLEQVLHRLRREYEAAGKADVFHELKGVFWGEQASQGYAEIGRRLGLSEGAVKVAAHRFRARYREWLRVEIGRTVERSEEVEDELRHLMDVVGS